MNLGRFVDTALASSAPPAPPQQIHPASLGEHHDTDQQQSDRSQYLLAYFTLGAVCVLASVVLLYPVILQAPPAGESSYVPPAEPLSAPSEPLALREAQKASLEKNLLEKVRPIPASDYPGNLKIYLQLVQSAEERSL